MKKYERKEWKTVLYYKIKNNDSGSNLDLYNIL